MCFRRLPVLDAAAILRRLGGRLFTFEVPE